MGELMNLITSHTSIACAVFLSVVLLLAITARIAYRFGKHAGYVQTATHYRLAR